MFIIQYIMFIIQYIILLTTVSVAEFVQLVQLGLTIISQTTWDRRISKFSSSSWERFKRLAMTQLVCHKWGVMFAQINE